MNSSIGFGLVGFGLGIGTSIYVIAKLLSIRSTTSSNINISSKTSNTDTTTDSDTIKTHTISDSEINNIKIVIDTLLVKLNSSTTTAAATNSDIPSIITRRINDIYNNNDSNDIDITTISTTTTNLMNLYTTCLNESKHRCRQLKAMTVFTSDLKKMLESYTKDMQRLSSVAKSNSSSNNSSSSSSISINSNYKGNDEYALVFQRWWSMLSDSLDALSQDQSILSERISIDVIDKIKALTQEQHILEEKLSTDGTRLQSLYKDALLLNDKNLKERMKWKDKVDSTNDDTSFFVDSNKRINRLQQCEEELMKSKENLHDVTQRIEGTLPKIIFDMESVSYKCMVDSKLLIQKLVERMHSAQSNSTRTLEKLKLRLDMLSSSDASSLNPSDDILIQLKPTLESLSKSDTNASAIKLDMTLDSTAILASAPTSAIPKLPPALADTVEKETCIWFMAIVGRMYRDMNSSKYFHDWFCEKLGKVLNKKRPGFIDTFICESIAFGTLPPLLSNLKWLPTVGEPDTNVSFLGDVNFCSGIKFRIKSFINVNWPREKYASIPITIDLEIVQVTGRFKFSVDIESSHLCFLEEPDIVLKSYFEAGDKLKVKGIPLVSDYVIKKVRKFIRNKLIYPNTHKFRLIWPRNWWPDTANTANNTITTNDNNNDNNNNATIKTNNDDSKGNNNDINNKLRDFTIMNKTKIFDEKFQVFIEASILERRFVSSINTKRCTSLTNILNDTKTNTINMKRYNSISDFRTEKVQDIILKRHNGTLLGNTNKGDRTALESPTSMKRSLVAKGKNILGKFWNKIDRAGSSSGGIDGDDKSSSLINDNDDTIDSKSKSNLVSIFKNKLSSTKETFKKVVKEQLDKRRTSLKSDEI